MGRVGVEPFTIRTRLRHAQTVAFLRNRREIANDHDVGFVIMTMTDEADDGSLSVVVLNPLKTRRNKILLIKCWRLLIEVIQVAHEALYARMQRVIQQMPI